MRSHTSPKSNNDGFLRDFRSFSRGAQRSISVSSHARLSLPRCRGTVRGGGTLPLGAPRGIYSGGGWAPPTAQPLAALPRCRGEVNSNTLYSASNSATRARTLRPLPRRYTTSFYTFFSTVNSPRDPHDLMQPGSHHKYTSHIHYMQSSQLTP